MENRTPNITEKVFCEIQRYERVGKFTPTALTRLLGISVERNWWRIFDYDDAVAHAEKRSACDFWKDLRGFVWDCTVKAFALRQLLSGEPMAVKFDQYWHEDDISGKRSAPFPILSISRRASGCGQN